MNDHIDPIVIKDAEIIFRNFEGRPGPFNAAGNREFTLVLPEAVGRQYQKLGWKYANFKGTIWIS